MGNLFEFLNKGVQEENPIMMFKFLKNPFE